MWNLNYLSTRRIIAGCIVAIQFTASIPPVIAQTSSQSAGSGGYDQQGDYGYQGSSSQSSGFDALRSRCNGPDAGPECAALSGGGASGVSGFGGTPGIPQIYSSESGMDAYYALAGRGDESLRTFPISPQPPTEFQKFVYASVGQRLTIFGANLFVNAPSTFAPVDRAPVPSDYVVGPGDQLLIRGWGQVDINVRATVDRSGNVYVPKVGMISVTGVKFSELVPYLKGVISRNFRNFDLSVSMGQLRSIQIFVVGQARRPGSYTVSSLSSLVNAVFYSGGPLNTGSMRRIQLRRGDAVVVEFDLYDLLLRGDKSKDVTLLPGDVIFIPPVGPQVAMVGSVNTPAVYELKGNTTLAEAVKLAGGFTALTDNNKATVERVEQGDHQTFRRVEDFPLNDSGLSRLLQNADIVRIAPMLPRFEETVTLRGNVAWPGRYPWHDGMRIRDLIPSKEALLTRDFWRQQNPVYSATGEVRLSPNTGYEPRDGNGTGESSAGGTQPAQGTDQQSSEQRATTNPNQANAQAGAPISSKTNNVAPNAEITVRQGTYAASTLALARLDCAMTSRQQHQKLTGIMRSFRGLTKMISLRLWSRLI